MGVDTASPCHSVSYIVTFLLKKWEITILYKLNKFKASEMLFPSQGLMEEVKPTKSDSCQEIPTIRKYPCNFQSKRQPLYLKPEVKIFVVCTTNHHTKSLAIILHG